MKRVLAQIFWLLLALAGATAYATLAFRRSEPVNSAYILIAAVCTYAIGYRFYSKWIAARVLALNERRATPCEVHDDGKDFVKTNKWVVFGHHFAAIAGRDRSSGRCSPRNLAICRGRCGFSSGPCSAARCRILPFVLLDAPGRQIARPDGQGGIEFAGRLHRGAGDSGHSGDYARGPRARRGQGPRRKSLGHFHRGGNHSHRAVHGRLHAVLAGGQSAGGLGHRCHAAVAGGMGGKLVYESFYWREKFGLHDITLAWRSLFMAWRPACCRSGCCLRRAIISARS